MPRTTLYLVRHGEQDRAEDAGLSPLGREQAGKLGRRLAGTQFDALHYSSLPRAEQTAAVLAGHLPEVPSHACDLVRDRTPMPSDDTDYPERYQDFFQQVPENERDPGATSLKAAVHELSALGDRDRTDLIVTHNFVIGWFVRHVLDAPHWRWLGLNQANCGLSVLTWETGRPPALVSFNDVGHL